MNNVRRRGVPVFLYRFLTTHMIYLFSKGVFRTSTVPPFYPRAFSLTVIMLFALALKRNLLFDEHFPIHFLFFFGLHDVSSSLDSPSLYLTCSRYPESLICSDLVGSAYTHFTLIHSHGQLPPFPVVFNVTYILLLVMNSRAGAGKVQLLPSSASLEYSVQVW